MHTSINALNLMHNFINHVYVGFELVGYQCIYLDIHYCHGFPVICVLYDKGPALKPFLLEQTIEESQQIIYFSGHGCGGADVCCEGTEILNWTVVACLS